MFVIPYIVCIRKHFMPVHIGIKRKKDVLKLMEEHAEERAYQWEEKRLNIEAEVAMG